MNSKIFLFCLLSICNTGFSQTYKFDLRTSYKYYNPYLEKYADRVVYTNGNDQDYFMFVNKNRKAFIFDLRSMKQYDVKLSKKNISDKENNITLKKVSEIEQVELTKDFQFTFETIAEDSTHKMIKMTIFNSVKKQEPATILHLRLKKFSANLFPLFRYSFLHLYETRKEINPGENGIVESVTIPGQEKPIAWLESAEKVAIEIDVNN